MTGYLDVYRGEGGCGFVTKGPPLVISNEVRDPAIQQKNILPLLFISQKPPLYKKKNPAVRRGFSN
jgi:hypothetical protein